MTVLFPFLPCPDLGPDVRVRAGVHRRPHADRSRSASSTCGASQGLVWIEPEPADPFATLTAAVADRWPDYPPYGGLFEAVIPHLTVVESDDAPLEEVENAVRQVAPFTARAERLEVWCQDAAGRWRPRWRLPFGVRP